MDPDEPEGNEAIGERPPGDALALEVARSRIANSLFATDERVRFGRYQLLERAGAGGMGAVWSAWDPELERRVAIKVMHVESAAARDYMLREGQALAQLSHPNIVPVYDVGSVGDRVYLVMEWIAGVTLRAYVSEPRTVKELVAVYMAAGTGVAAAHRAGIVQRDFKPDNVMIGEDGRVRVLDFGLARGEEGVIAGTPRYMAPEQARGEEVTPAADQYAFGVALHEALAKRGELPAWLAAIVTRATAAEPAARYPDMDALLAALSRDPARLWRRRAAVAGAVLAAGTAFAIGTLRADEPVACTGAVDELADTWSAPRADAIRAHVRTLGKYGESEATTLVTQLARYGERWVGARRGACLARRRGDVTTAIYERGLACFERSRAALDGVASALARVKQDKLPDAVTAARGLPDPARCIADATTDPVAPPPREVAARVTTVAANATRARYLALASDPSATEIARAAAAEAAALAYAPLTARTQLALGAALETDRSTQKTKAPVEAYRAASDAALSAGDDVMFVEAFARELFAASRRGHERVPELVAALSFVRAIGKRTGDRGGFARALLYNNAGTQRMAAGDPAGALAWLREARTALDEHPYGVELWAILGNLAMVVTDHGERDALFAAESVQFERVLGPDHPLTLSARLRAAAFVDDPHESSVRLAETCRTWLARHPQRRDKVASCHYELGWLAVQRDDTAAAIAAFRTVTSQADSTANNQLALAELARLGGDPHRAIGLATIVAASIKRRDGWWDLVPRIDAWLTIAAAYHALANDRAALAALDRARSMTLHPLLSHPVTPVQRRRARVTTLLAIATLVW